MAITSDLTGLGMAPALAGKVGHEITNPLVGIGTAQSGARPIGTSVTVGVPVGGSTAYTLPAKTKASSMGKEFYFFNAAATAVSALVYPAADGSTLDGSTSAAVTIPQNKGCLFMLVKASGGAAPQWVSLLGS